MKPSTVPRSRSCDRRFYGVAEGIVHDVNDPEKEGRIKVSFPWFDGETISEWCRVMQFYAGNGYGSFFVPEVGDEVLVGFVHGDMRLPIIMGGLYNGSDKPSTHRADDKDQKLIRTKAGHQILLDDSKDAEKIELTTQGGHVLDLDDAAGKVALTTSGGHEVTVDDDGQCITVTSSSGHEITLDDGGGSITISTPSGQSIVMDDSSIKLSGSSVTIEASSITADSTDIKLGGMAAMEPVILGQLFMTLFNAHTHPSPLFGIPTGPPIVPMNPAMLAKTTKAT
ncbi:phage baseplate assembly protein V [Haliangium sp.]|uniref:phage baseplate assembly protein V n=1 Tax=Haliangium sp. TaxID=2663208 RepID=UPI003D099A4E